MNNAQKVLKLFKASEANVLSDSDYFILFSAGLPLTQVCQNYSGLLKLFE